MSIEEADDLIAQSLDGRLDAEAFARLQAHLKNDPAARQRYIDQMLLDASLAEEFSAAGVGGMVDMVGAGAPKTADAAIIHPDFRGGGFGLRFWPTLVFVALLAVVVMVSWMTKPQPVSNPSEILAEVLSVEDAEWGSGSRSMKNGQGLKYSSYALKSGRVEVRFADGALVALTGPATFRISGRNEMELTAGRLSADVPQRATGFTVATPVSKVRDLGTRFGVAVRDDGATEAHVFEGSVDVVQAVSNAREKPQRLRVNEAVAIDAGAKIQSTMAADPSAFPLPRKTVDAAMPCAGFESGASGWGANDALPPSVFNVWGGDHCARVGAERGVRPKSGAAMLHFINAAREGTPATHAGNASERYCWIDLRPYREEWRGRRVTGEFSTYFNRVSSGPDGVYSAKVIAATFGPGIKPGLTAWQGRLYRNTPGQARSNAEVAISTDEDPGTWEQAVTRFTIPPDAEILLLSIRAQNEDGDAMLRHYDDMYADEPVLTFQLGDAIIEKKIK